MRRIRVELDKRLADWVSNDLLSDDQAAAIGAYERARVRGGGRIPLAAEAAGYVGGILAIIGVGVLLGDVWARLSPEGLVGLSLVVTAALVWVGFALRDATEPAGQRLASVTWFLATGGIASTAGLYAQGVGDLSGEAATLLVGTSVTALAAVLWHRRREALQVVALFGGSVTIVCGLLLPIDDISALTVGVVLIATGAAWVAAGLRGRVEPTAVSMAMGGVLVLIGSQVVGAGNDRGLGLFLALAVAGAFLALAVADEQPGLLVLGAVGVFITVPQAVFHFFGDTIGAPFALLLTGAALLGGALMTVRLRQEV